MPAYHAVSQHKLLPDGVSHLPPTEVSHSAPSIDRVVLETVLSMCNFIHACAHVCLRARGPRNVCVRACVRQCAFVCENGCVRHLEALLGASAATAESQTKLRTSGISAAASTTTTLPSEPGHLPASAAVRVSARRVRMRS